jgi:hypothetical protein
MSGLRGIKMRMKTPIVGAVKSFNDGRVGLRINLDCSDFGGVLSHITASADITATEARTLAASLIALAELAEAKVAKKAAAEDRRQQWRNREIAAGRMKVMTW